MLGAKMVEEEEVYSRFKTTRVLSLSRKAVILGDSNLCVCWDSLTDCRVVYGCLKGKAFY
jgi:hypothetical protein